MLGHCTVGGTTSGCWTMVVWYLPLLPFLEPLQAAPQAWFPLFCYVQDREVATHHPTPPSGDMAVPQVVWFESLVQDWGLFPASDLEVRVLVQCSLSPSGYGACCLTCMKLGGLWDLPISIMDAVLPSGAELMVHVFCKTMPTKILLAGAGLLLTLSFQGGLGGLKKVLGSLTTRGQDDQSPPSHGPGPRPLSNSELGLSTAPACTAPPMLHSLDAVHKGDSQKAESAAVPVHLWLRAFALGYGDPSCLACHQYPLGLLGGLAGSLLNSGPPPG